MTPFVIFEKYHFVVIKNKAIMNKKELTEKLRFVKLLNGSHSHSPIYIKLGTCICCELPAMILETGHFSNGICYSCISELFTQAPTIPIDQHIMLLEEENAKVNSKVSELDEQKQKHEEYGNRLKRKMCDLQKDK